MRIVLWVLIGCLCHRPVWGETRLNAERIRSWADTYFGDALHKRRINGALLTVVQGGEPILLLGYGSADVAAGRPIDPLSTRVAICSNSKVFTATALLQLVDAGRIASIDDPANKYLQRFQLPRVDGRDITLFELLTHRAGFGQGRFNEMTIAGLQGPASGLDYRRLLGGFTNSPGTVSSYANSGAAVLGAVVEDVSGETLAAYLQRHIFDPLGMSSTSFVAGGPPPAGIARPVRYFPDGSYEPVIWFGKHPVFAPGGGIVSTAPDMARFVAAQADEGRRASASLLGHATFERMHTQQVSNHALLNGLGLQYFTSHSNGERVASHTCSLPGFSTAHAIFPESDAGVFVAILADEGVRGRWWEFAFASFAPTRMKRNPDVPFDEPLAASDALDALRASAMDLPPAYPPASAESSGALPASDYFGTYITDRRPVGSMLSFAPIFSTMYEVTRGPNDVSLRINGTHYQQIAPDVFDTADGTRRIAFQRDGLTVARLVSTISSATRVGSIDDPSLAAGIILWVACFTVTGLLALAWPAGGSLEGAARWAPAVLAAAAVAILWSVLFTGDPARGVIDITDAIDVGEAGSLWTVLVAADAFLVAAAAMIVALPAAWTLGWWGARRAGVLRRMHFTTLAGCALAMSVFLLSFDVIAVRPTPEPWPAEPTFSLQSERPASAEKGEKS